MNDSGNSTNTLGQSTMQGQSTTQGQKIGDTTSSSGGNSIDASDRSSTSIDASSHYQNRTVFIPSVTQPILPSIVAPAGVTVQVGACGPRQAVNSVAVNGTFVGLVRRTAIQQGVTDTTVQADQPFREIALPDGTRRVYGHQVVTYVSVVGISGSRNLALGGGGGSNSNWGQGSLGSSAANQQMVIRHVLQECELGLIRPEVPVVLEVRG